MKTRSFFITLFCILSFSLASKAQSIIKLNALSLAFKTLSVGFEQDLSEKTSLYVSGRIIFRDIDGIRYTGGGLGGQYRFYIADADFPEGLYVGPSAGLSYIGYNFRGARNTYALIEIGGIIGYQWEIGNRFTVETGVGPTLGFVTGQSRDIEVLSIFGEGVSPTALVTVGYIIGE